MDDLNLIPYEVKVEKERRTKKVKSITLLFFAVFIAGAATAILIYYTYNINLENKALEREIVKLSYVAEEIEVFTTKKNIAGEQAAIMELILKGEIKWSEIMEDISSMMPGEASIEDIRGESGLIFMSCTSQNIGAIAELYANLQNSHRFTSVELNEIVPYEGKENYRFSLSLTLK